MTTRWPHATMCLVETPESPVEERLRQTLRTFRRANAAQEKARLEFRAAIKAAREAGKGPAEITRLIDHEYDVAHVSRIIHGKA
jgi:hypothetical protein